MNRIKPIHWIVFAVALVGAFAARTLYYYRGIYQAPDVPTQEIPSVVSRADNVEASVTMDGAGKTVVIDTGHDNGFNPDELALFAGRLANSGADVQYSEDLKASLRNADTIVVVAANNLFGVDEVLEVQSFVDKGGHLILIADPTRQSDAEGMNSLSAAFGVVYQNDYMFSLTRNDGNFRNVIFTEFAADQPLTSGLNEVVFQTGTSIRTTSGTALISGDDEVFSSRNELAGGVTAAALTVEGRVLALPDMTFLTNPYNSFADNDVLVDNVVDFALSSKRSFGLTDFPFFFEGDTQIVYQDAVLLNNTFASMIGLRTAVNEVGITAHLIEELDIDSEFIYLGLYDGADEDVVDLLDADGVTYSDEPLDEENAPDSTGTISIEGVARLDRTGMVLLHVARPADLEPAEDTSGDGDAADSSDESGSEAADSDSDTGAGDAEESGDESTGEPYQLVVLAGSEEGLQFGIDLLLSGKLDECLVTAWTAVCPTGEIDLEDEPTPTPGGGPGGGDSFRVLVVSDDTGLTLGGQNSALEIAEVLDAAGHEIGFYSLADNDNPTIGILAEFDMVFWSGGDYCCTVPLQENVELLMEYVDGGGSLFIDGTFIATDWGDTPFLNDYLNATFEGFAGMSDLEVDDSSHPVAAGLSGVLDLNLPGGEPVQPDVIGADDRASVILVRGPDSEAAGEPALIASEIGTAKVVYAAFSTYIMQPSDLGTLMSNIADWFGQ